MTAASDLEQRLGDLESHLAHQDVALQDLSDVAARQGATIDELKRAIDRLKERLLIAETEVQSVLPKDPPPPHY